MTPLERERQRFEEWFRVTYPLWREDKDSTLKHRLWTAWQVAALGSETHSAVHGSKD